MASKTDIVAARERVERGKTGAEVAEGIGRVLIDQVPVLGSLVSEFIPKRSEERIKSFCLDLGEFVEQLDEEVKKRVTSDEFAYLFSRCARSVAIEHREEKIRAYQNFLRTSLVHPTTEDIEPLYLSKLDSLSIQHLEVLHAIWVTGRDRWLTYVMDSGDLVIPGDELLKLLPNFSYRVVFSFVKELEAMGLLWLPTALAGFSDIKGIQMDHLDVALSDFAIGFLSFITPEHPLTAAQEERVVKHRGRTFAPTHQNKEGA